DGGRCPVAQPAARLPVQAPRRLGRRPGRQPDPARPGSQLGPGLTCSAVAARGDVGGTESRRATKGVWPAPLVATPSWSPLRLVDPGAAVGPVRFPPGPAVLEAAGNFVRPVNPSCVDLRWVFHIVHLDRCPLAVAGTAVEGHVHSRHASTLTGLSGNNPLVT